MSRAVAPVDVCNLALDYLGIAPISSIEQPETDEEKVCARWYDTTRQEVLRGFVFNFSKEFATLTQNQLVTAPSPYSVAFSLPLDCLRLLVVGDELTTGIKTRYDISKRLLYLGSDTFVSSSGTSQINIAYIKDSVIVTEFDALFVKLLAATLAQNMAYKFTLKPSVFKAIADAVEKFEVRAAAVDGQERPPRRIERSKFRNARRRVGLSSVAGPLTFLP